MSDECLMKQETAFPFYIVYQAVMRKFTLADITHCLLFEGFGRAKLGCLGVGVILKRIGILLFLYERLKSN
jgi:hypothetical protein